MKVVSYHISGTKNAQKLAKIFFLENSAKKTMGGIKFWMLYLVLEDIN